MSARPDVLVLDAMGVLYQAADDVAELLVPFIAEQGGSTDGAHIQGRYEAVSLGRITPDAFWAEVGVAPAQEAAYLSRHRLMPGVAEFLAQAAARFDTVGCLSNDVGRWSHWLRQTHGLERWIRTWVISGDVGLRKPDPAIYRRLTAALGCDPGRVLFVDDRPRNLDAARALGLHTVCMKPLGKADPGHPTVTHLDEVLALWERWR